VLTVCYGFTVTEKSRLLPLLARLDGEPADALETETLEFKAWEADPRARARTLRETAVCLANAKGGTIVLGVADRARTRREAILGVSGYDVAAIRRAIYDGTDPHILVEVEELVVPEGTLLLVHVPRGLPPHTTTDGVAKVRVGKDCVPLTGRLLAQLMASGGQRDPTAEAPAGATESDLDPEALAELRRTVEREAQARELARLDDAALLRALGLVLRGGEVTLAGLLLVGSAEALQRYIPQHEITFLRYESATRYDQRRDLRGPLLPALRELERLLSVHNRVRTLQEPGFGQLEVPDLSWEVAREAVLNAVAHRDYFLRQGVLVALHRDLLEVVSPGGFAGGITPENVLRHPPVHRNELLARALQSIGLVNRVGLGVDRIYEGLLRLGKDLPRWEADETHVRLVISLETHAEMALFVEAERRRGAALDLDDLVVLRALLTRDRLDRGGAARALQLPEDEAARRLAAMRARGLLAVRGRGRSAAYDLRRDLGGRLRGGTTPDATRRLDVAEARARVLAALRERGRLTNADIRRLSGLSRAEAYRLVKSLETEGCVRFVGAGRGAAIEPVIRRRRRKT
jgi:ATP-dependent DNA helicase RecG